jgi:hypothetical protein
MRKLWILGNTGLLPAEHIQQYRVRMKKLSGCEQHMTAALCIAIHWSERSVAYSLMQFRL